MKTYSEEFEEFWKEYTSSWTDVLFKHALKEIAYDAWEARPKWVD